MLLEYILFDSPSYGIIIMTPCQVDCGFLADILIYWIRIILAHAFYDNTVQKLLVEHLILNCFLVFP